MRRGVGISLILVCVCLCSCGDAKLECGADEVKGTLASMVRGRYLLTAGDAYPRSFDASKRARLSKATRVTTLETKLLEWDAITGRLTCMARVVVDAPGSVIDTNLRNETELHYRVTRDGDDTFLVEVAFAELMALFPVRQAPERAPRRLP